MERVAGIVLAGGRSSRMRADKASLVLGGRTLLQHALDALAEVVEEIVVVRAPGRRLPDLSSPRPIGVAEDAVEGQGPLVGIAAGLAATAMPVALVVACDTPFLRPALLRLLAERALAGRDMVVPVYEGRDQPLCSAIARAALPVVEAHIAAGDRRIMSVAADLDMERVPPEQWRGADPEGRSFENVNTPEEFEAAAARLAGR